MSADLLRRAAAKLREHAETALSVAPGAWLYAPSDPRPDRVVLAEGHVTPVATVYENCELPKLSAYLVAVHPPVALALADWLETEAEEDPSFTPCKYAAIAVARAVLREPGDTP